MSENNLQGRLAEYRTQKALHGLGEEVHNITTPITAEDTSQSDMAAALNRLSAGTSTELQPRTTTQSDMAAALNRLSAGTSTELQPPTTSPAQIDAALRTMYGPSTFYTPEQRSEVISRISLGLPIEAVPIAASIPRPWEIDYSTPETTPIDTDEQYQAALQQVSTIHEADTRMTPSSAPPKPVDLDPYKVVRAEPSNTRDENRSVGNPELLSEPISLHYSIGDLLSDTEITDKIEELNRYQLNIGSFRRNFSDASFNPLSADRFLEQYRLERYFSADQITPENYGKTLGIIRARALIERENFNIRHNAMYSPEVTRATRQALADMDDLLFGNNDLNSDIQKARQDITTIVKSAEDRIVKLREQKAIKVRPTRSERVNKLTQTISEWQFRTANGLPAKFIPDLRRHVANNEWNIIKLKYNIPESQFDKDQFLAYICFEESYDDLIEELEDATVDKIAELGLDQDEFNPSVQPPRP